MATELRAKKRKRSSTSSDPSRGIFTRSRSKIFLHCNRSGRTRSFLCSKQNQVTEIKSADSSLRNPKALIEETFNNGESISRISIKDLRARRVFSPASFPSEKGDVGGAKVEDAKLQFHVELLPENQKNSGNTEKLISRDDEWFQTTPPDEDVFCKSNQKTDLDLENRSSDRVSSNSGGVGEGEKHNQSNSKTRSGVLIPCSRMKLFKVPNSFSYRRLIPYLMEIEKDHSSVLGSSPCQKVEKSVEESPLPSPSASLDQHILADRADTELLSVGCLLGGSEAPPTSRLKEMTPLIVSSNIYCPNSESPEQPITESSIQKPPENSFSPVSDPMITKPPISHSECASQVPQDISDKSSKMGPAHDVIGSVHVGEAEIKDAKLRFDVEQCLEDQKNNANTENSISCGGELFQTTPDGDDLCKSKQKTNLLLGKPFSKSFSIKGSRIGECQKHNQSNSKAKSGIYIPSSRMKLFKTPSSFSYRRLLPFLMDIEKDNSDALGTSLCRRVEKTVEDRTLPALSASTAEQIPIDGANMQVLPVEHPIGDSGVLPTPKSREMSLLTFSSNIYFPDLESSEQSITESVIERPLETLISPVYDSIVMALPNSYTENESQVQQDTVDKSSKLELDHDMIGSVHETGLPVKSPCSPPIIPGGLSMNEGSLESHSHLSTEVEDRATLVPQLGTEVKPIEAPSLHQDSFDVKALVPSEKPVCVPTKGILKRYPRGCRGLCNCLNCASFLLHAERAFEFSKNQMQDAEEVTVGLMKELSSLRSLLEKSVDGTDCHAVVPVNQVKGACRKASKAEELAKIRLRQMNQELNIHCRTTNLQRPSVRFAD